MARLRQSARGTGLGQGKQHTPGGRAEVLCWTKPQRRPLDIDSTPRASAPRAIDCADVVTAGEQDLLQQLHAIEFQYLSHPVSRATHRALAGLSMGRVSATERQTQREEHRAQERQSLGQAKG